VSIPGASGRHFHFLCLARARGGVGSGESALFVDVQEAADQWFNKEARGGKMFGNHTGSYVFVYLNYEFADGDASKPVDGVDYRKYMVDMGDGSSSFEERLFVTCTVLRSRLSRPCHGVTLNDAKTIAGMMDKGWFVPSSVYKVGGSTTTLSPTSPPPLPPAASPVPPPPASPAPPP